MTDVRVRFEGGNAEELVDDLAAAERGYAEEDVPEAVRNWDAEFGSTAEGALSHTPAVEALSLVIDIGRDVGTQVLAAWIAHRMIHHDVESVSIDGEAVERSEEAVRERLEGVASGEEPEGDGGS
jgi:mannose/cellobiose epimerase-like protein (N-acyl-D-glucosamine 2-epimerase family)